MKYSNTARWFTCVSASVFAMGCAANGQQFTDKSKPRKCHASQIMSRDVKGHGSRKTYSKCRCMYPNEFGRGFPNNDF